MRVMAWNIFQGGASRKGDRTEPILEVIASFDPDVVGLCECGSFADDDMARLRLFGERLGMTGFVNQSHSGSHLAMLYKPSLPVVKHHAEPSSVYFMYNGFAGISLESAELGKVDVVVTHLNSFSSWYRVVEAQTLITKAGAGKAVGSIIMGDLNNLAPADLPVDLSNASLRLRARLTGVDQAINTQPIDVLLNHGYVDLGATEGQHTYPTPLDGKREQHGMTLRLDYMFATRVLAERCKDFRVIDGDLAERASDHLPVTADFALEL